MLIPLPGQLESAMDYPRGSAFPYTLSFLASNPLALLYGCAATSGRFEPSGIFL